jgi:hypothetical protein
LTRFRGLGGRRRLAVGCCAAALVATATGTASALDNLPPKQPLVRDLQSGYRPCATGDDTVYVSEPPRLSAVLYDPEEDNQPSEASPVKGEFEAWWTDSAGVEQRRTYTTITLSSDRRVVVPDEVTELARRKAKGLGHWSLENATDGVSPEQSDGTPLRLSPGATIHRGPDDSCLPELDPDCPEVPYALVGDGHLSLDGETGYASLDGPLVDTADSFSVGAVVRLADAEPGRPMTLLSQAGEHTDAFKVRYQPPDHTWQLVMPEKDEAGAPEKVVSRIEGADGGEGQGHRLAVVYDDATDTIKLYLDGYTNAEATATLSDGWHSSGKFQVGRTRIGDGWGEYLHGDVDEIQAYSGALRDRDIGSLGRGTDPCLC